MNEVESTKAPRRGLLGILDGLSRRAVLGKLAGLSAGRLTVREGVRELHLGADEELHAKVAVHDPRVYRRAAIGGTLGLAESYLAGEWDSDDLAAVIQLFVRDGVAASRFEQGLAAKLANAARRIAGLRLDNSRRGSRRNIAAHYDLGNEFYQLWLDETMAYSSAVFPARASTLREASMEKFDRVCRKLELRPGDEVVEIGGGWGGFALHAAANYGCRVTSTTISAAQYGHMRNAIQSAGLEDRITVLNQDYRDLSGTFDKLVSIEMIEAVGRRRLGDYFQQCSKLLRADGSMVVQAIVAPEQGYDRYLKSVDFFQRYIFPGGCLPSLGSMMNAIGRKTDLRVAHVEDFAPHYAETSRRWRQTFLARLDEVRALGATERFIRLWDFYLCTCEAVFEERAIGVVQIQFDKPRCRRDGADLTRQSAICSPRTTAHDRRPTTHSTSSTRHLSEV